MRPIALLLVSLAALSAHADCTPRTLVRSSGPIFVAHVDHGTLYYSIVAQKTIWRLDEATGQSTPFFTAGRALERWDIDDGMLVVQTAANELTVAGRGVITEPLPIRTLHVQDGFVYWTEEDRALRRTPLDGGPIETVVTELPADDYIVFHDRVVFATAEGLYWQPLNGGARVLLQPRADITAVDAVDDGGILISTHAPFDPNVAKASLLRVPWAGGPVETVYETTFPGYAPNVTLKAVVAGATTYIVRTSVEHFFFTSSTLIVLRNGVARQRYGAVGAPLWILDASEDEITLAQWVDASGMKQVERICAAAPKGRAAAR